MIVYASVIVRQENFCLGGEADGRGGGVAGFLTKATYMDFGLRGILI